VIPSSPKSDAASNPSPALVAISKAVMSCASAQGAIRDDAISPVTLFAFLILPQPQELPQRCCPTPPPP
jgi:hypothetical protein